jgi:hypothetical protein
VSAEANASGLSRDLRSTISGVARKVFATQLLLGILTWTVACVGMWMALFLLDNLLRLPPALRFPLALGGLSATAYLLWRLVIRVAKKRNSRDQIAVMLERKYAIAGNVVINALQFGGASIPEAQRPFVERTISLGANKLEGVSLGDLSETGRLLKWGGLVLAALLVLGGYVRLAPSYFGNAASRYLFSLSDMPPASSLVLTVTPGNDIFIAETEDVEVRVVVSGLKAHDTLKEYPHLYWREGTDGVSSVRGGESHFIMHPVVDEERTYRHRFAGVRNSFSFRVFASDTYTRSIAVHVAPAPRITASQCRVTLPWYTGGRVVPALGPPSPVECLPDSRLDVELEMNRPCRSLFWRTGDGSLEFTREGDRWKVRYPVKRGGPYDVEIEADDLDRKITVASGVVSLLADEPPSVDFLDAVTNRTVTPGERIALKVRAQDHYGLRDVRITARPALGGGDSRTLRTWRYGDSRVVEVEGKSLDRDELTDALLKQLGKDADEEMIRKSVEHYSTNVEGGVRVDIPPGSNQVVHETASITIDASIFEPGYKYYIEALASDFCPHNEASVSKALMITVRDISDVAIVGEEELGKLYGALDAAIRHQRKAIDHTDTFLTHADSVWKDMYGKPLPPDKVLKLLGLHRQNILGEQKQVLGSLSGALARTRSPSPIVLRVREICRNEAVEANDRASMLNGISIDLGLGPPVYRGRLDRVKRDPAVSLKRTARGRYLGLLIESVSRWNDRSSFSRLSLLDSNGKSIPSDGWKVKALRGMKGVKINAQPWNAGGPLPHFLVVDMGKTQSVVKFDIPQDRYGVGRFRLFLSGSWSGRVDVPEMPDRESALRSAESLKRVQQLIYSQLIALKGKEIVRRDSAANREAEEALFGEQVPLAPLPDDALKDLKEELRDWKIRHEKNAELREKLMNKLAEDFSEEDAEKLDELVIEKEIQARELKDYVNNFTTGAGMDQGDSQQAKINAEILNELDRIRQLENEAVAIAKGGDFTESLDDQISMGMEGIAGGSKKQEDSKSTDVPGGAEQPEDSGRPPYTPGLADSLNATVDELEGQLESISEDLSFATTAMSGALGKNPQDNIVGGQYSSMAAAGQMGDVTPDPMKNASGRSGVGRSGQADGQFVGDSTPLIPDDEVAMPNRMSDTAAEAGQDIKDEGAAPPTSVGMGKSTASQTDFGKSGKMPPEFYKKLRAVGEDVENFDETCNDMLMQLNREGLPSGDLKTAMLRMRSLLEAMKKGDGVGVRAAYDDALKHVRLARTAILRELERRAAENKNWKMERDHVIRQALVELKGYEEMIGDYFKKLAEDGEE